MSSNPNNIVYPKAKEYFMSGAIALTGGAYSSVATANQASKKIAHVVLFKSGAVHGAADYLLAHYSTGSGGAFNINTNGGDITIKWNGSGIFKL